MTMKPARELHPEMVRYLDERLATNGLAKEARRNLYPRRDAVILMRLAAQVCVGVREEGGNNQGPLVKLFQDTVNGPDPYAWCLSFVQTCVGYAELHSKVISPLAVTEHCLTAWNAAASERDTRYQVPFPGAIVFWRRGVTINGHCGIVEAGPSPGGLSFLAIEGNATYRGLEGVVVRDGGGVALTERSLGGAPGMTLLGFIRPF